MKHNNRKFFKAVAFLAVSAVIAMSMCISTFAKYPDSPNWIYDEPAGEILYGESFGTEAYGGGENTYSLALDGNPDTFFDSLSGGAFTTWVGVELVSPARLTEFRWHPRDGFTDRSVGACIQGSNDGFDWTDIYTIYDQPELDYVSVSADYFETDEYFTMFRYTQSTDTHLDVAEVEFYGQYEASEISADAENTLPEPPAAATDDSERKIMTAIFIVLVILVLILACVNVLMRIALQKRKDLRNFK